MASLIPRSRFVRSFFLRMRTSLTPPQDTRDGLNPHATSRTPSPSHTSVDEWTATSSTLVVGSPTSPHSRETAELKLRVSQLEAAVEELRCRLDTLTTGRQGMLIALVV